MPELTNVGVPDYDDDSLESTTSTDLSDSSSSSNTDLSSTIEPPDFSPLSSEKSFSEPDAAEESAQNPTHSLSSAIGEEQDVDERESPSGMVIHLYYFTIIKFLC